MLLAGLHLGKARRRTTAARLLARISYAQAVMVLVMVFLAAAMTRGYGVASSQ